VVRLVQHLANAVQGSVGERGSLAEEKLARAEGLQSWSEQLSRLLNEHPLVALPRVHTASAELALLDENVERAISWRGPGFADGWRPDSEHYVLQGTIDEVGVGPNGPLPRWRNQSRACLADQQVLADVARLGDGATRVVHQNRDVGVASGGPRDVVSVAVRHLNEVVASAQQVEHHLHLSREGAVAKPKELHRSRV